MDLLERPGEAAGEPALQVIDCDVHPYVNSLKELYPYMPDAWRERFIRKGADVAGRGDNKSFRVLNPNGTSLRRDAKPPCGGMAGSNPAYIVEHLFRRNGIQSGILNCIQAGALNVLAQAEESIVLNAAFNDLFIHEWMPVDPGLKFAMTVPIADPLACADEIRRVGATPQIVAVSLPTLDMLMGMRYYYPVYAAAQEMDLPILVHITGTEGTYAGAPTSAGGLADSFVEKYSTTSQYAQVNIASLVFNGTFERFPEAEVRLRRVRLSVAAPAPVEDGPRVALAAARGAVGQEVADRVRARALPVHDPAARRAGRSEPPRQDDLDDGLRPALLQHRLSALGQRHARKLSAFAAQGRARQSFLRQRRGDVPP